MTELWGIGMDQPVLRLRSKPPKGEDGCKTFSVRLPIHLVAELDDISSRAGWSRNALIKSLLAHSLRFVEIDGEE